MKFFSLVLFSFLVLLPSVVFSQGLKWAPGILDKYTAPKAGVEGKKDLATVIGDIINVALSMVGMLFLVLMVYAGYLWMTARGEQTQIEKAQTIIRTSIIGLVIVLSAYAITFLITKRFE
ncbi:MAG: hypothetical protein AAB932_05195 [Patescibacteria group bacterium]